MYLQKYKKNNYSQFGEDGILDEILERLGKKISLNRWCVEFGAWDGISCSNTCNLIRHKNYKGILIESDRKKYQELLKNHPQKNVIKINKKIDITGHNKLDNILSATSIPLNYDFLSIDIDGMDYHIFSGIDVYKPKIICIEFNPSIPIDVEFVQEKNFKIKHGSSALSIFNLAEKKGYKLIACTNCNLIFIDKKIIKYVLKKTPKLNSICNQSQDNAIIFIGYDGSIISNKQKILLPWHDGYMVETEKLQYLPKIFRIYPGDWGIIRKSLFKFYRLFLG